MSRLHAAQAVAADGPSGTSTALGCDAGTCEPANQRVRSTWGGASISGMLRPRAGSPRMDCGSAVEIPLPLPHGRDLPWHLPAFGVLRPWRIAGDDRWRQLDSR